MSGPATDAEGDMLARGIGVALWRQVYMILRREIGDGLPSPGQRLPTEQDLAARFDVNRHTVRRALAALRDDGLIRVEQGRGAFLSDDVVEYSLGPRTRFSETLARQSRVPRVTLLRSMTVQADADIAAALDIPEGALTLQLDSIGDADDRRLCVSSRWYPLPRFAGLADRFRETGSITKALADFGVPDYTRRVTRITARIPSPEDARYLHQPRVRPVLVTESINVDGKGSPIEYGITQFASDRTQLVVEG